MDGVKEKVIEGDCTPWMDSGLVVKFEPAWTTEEDSPDQPSAVYSTAQPMSDKTSWSLLSLKRGRVCQHCSAAFVLVSSLELHLASVHGEPLPFPEWTEGSDRQKLEPAWSMEEDSPDQPSAVYSTAQPMSDNTSLLSLDSKHPCYLCPVAFVLVSSLELHLASVHGEKLHMVLPGPSTPDRCDAGNYSNTDADTEMASKRKVSSEDNSVKDGNMKGKKTKDRKKTLNKKVCSKVRSTRVKDGETKEKKGKGSKNSPKRKDNGDDSSDKVGTNRRRSHVCDICSKSYSKPCHLKIHKLTHSGIKPFVCDECSKGFVQACALNQHKKLHRSCNCPHCDSVLDGPADLRLHVKTVHKGIKRHVCDVCGAAFSQSGQLTIHRRIHTGEKPYVCSDCGKGFVERSALKKHSVTHTGEKSHICSDCGKGFGLSHSLKQHRLIHAREKLSKQSGKSSAQSSYPGRHSPTPSAHGEKPYMVLPGSSTPDRCDAGDCSNTDMDKEVDSHGNRKKATDVSDTDRNYDAGDKDGKDSGKEHVCEICCKAFWTIALLKRHKRTHSGYKPFECDVCQKRFLRCSDLNSHKQRHSGHKPFACDVCNVSFTKASDLTVHKRVHTGERPFKCPHCDSAFKRSGHLHDHQRLVHEKGKPHVCDFCGEAFSEIRRLTKHRRIHTGEKPHVCPDCGLGCSKLSRLRKHRLTHTGEKPHSCPHCPAAFRQPHHLKGHVRSMHQQLTL